VSMYDTIVADLECPYCGTRAPSAEVQSRMFEAPALRQFVVGDRVPPPADLAESTYFPIGNSQSGMAVLETWSCPRCGAWRWALVEVDGDRLAAVHAVPFTEPILAAADFIGDDFLPMLTDIDRRSLAPVVDRGRLRQALIRIQEDIDAHRGDRDDA
jgi:hypothetical protein